MPNTAKVNPELLPIQETLSLVPYSRDYVTRLAREKKIVATQVDRQWFIDPVSLKNFYESTRIEEQVRMQRLSEERKRALATKENRSLSERTISQNLVVADQMAMWQSALVIIAGLLVGVTMFAFHNGGATTYLASLIVPSSSDFTQTANVFNTSVAEPITSAPVVAPSNNNVANSLYASAPLSGGEGVLILPTGVDTNSSWYLEEVFSDDIEVEMLDSVRGVVRLKNNPGAEPLVFLRVPVTAINNASNFDTTP